MARRKASRAGEEECAAHPRSLTLREAASSGRAGQKPIWFGDWSSVAIRDVNQVVLFRFNERYMHKRQIGFMAYQRSDSRPLFSSTYSSSLRPIRSIVV